MIFLYVGNDIEKRSNASKSMIALLTTKRRDAEVIEFDDITFSPSRFLETINGMGLFETKSIMICRYTLEEKDHRDLVLSKLKDLQGSDNAYVFIESTLHNAHIKKFSAISDQVHEFKSPKKETRFNTFSLTDLLLKKDKKNLWLGYHNARDAGISNEEIHGILLWQLRCLLLTYNHTQASSGLKPFVFNKSKSAQRVWSKESTARSHFELIKNYHESRRGKKVLSLVIEDFILSL